MNKKKSLDKLGLAVTCIFLVFSIADASAANLLSWDKKINSKGRFKVLKQFNKEAVLDKETHLVWQREPNGMFGSKIAGSRICAKLELGGRLGWRLPTIEELASLVDSSQTDPALPKNHPFINVGNWAYLSSTVIHWNTGEVELRVDFNTATVTERDTTVGGGTFAEIWCVRGGQGTGGLYY